MGTKVKRFINTSNGNRVFVSDLTADASSLYNMNGAWPIKGLNGNFALLSARPWNIDTLLIESNGGCWMQGKFFPILGTSDVQIPKGTYLYAIGEYDTTEPRTTTTGAQYYQNYVYYLEVTTTPKIGLSTDYSAPIGVWEIINGATTAAMTGNQYQDFYMSLCVLWDWNQISMPIPNNSVGNEQISNNSITSNKIVNFSIGKDKLEPGILPNSLNFNIRASSPNLDLYVYPWQFTYFSNGGSGCKIHLSTTNTGTGVRASMGDRIKVIIGELSSTYSVDIYSDSTLLFTVTNNSFGVNPQDGSSKLNIEGVYNTAQSIWIVTANACL